MTSMSCDDVDVGDSCCRFSIVNFGNVGNFGNRFVRPTSPPSTPKNKDLAESTPALIFGISSRKLSCLKLKFTFQLTCSLGAKSPDGPPFVQIHDILYRMYRDILYTPARAERAQEQPRKWRGKRWMSENNVCGS